MAHLNKTLCILTILSVIGCSDLIVQPDESNRNDEDFETGEFNNLPWEHDGSGPWTIYTSFPVEGFYSFSSGVINRSALTHVLFLSYCV